MADTKLSELTAVTNDAVADTDSIYVVVGGVSVRMTVLEAKRLLQQGAGHAGMVGEADITDNEDGTLTIANHDAFFYVGGEIVKETVAGDNFTPTVDTTNYLVANYNGGTAQFELITDESLIDQLEILRTAEVYRSSSSPTNLHIQESQIHANTEVSKINQRTQETGRYGFTDGALRNISVSPSLAITASGGVVWAGSERYDIPATTAVTRAFYVTHVAGAYETNSSLGPVINNTQYDNLTEMVTLSEGKWTVNYIYRGIENQDHLYLVMGNAEHDSAELASAQSSAPPIPEIISSHAVLIGRVIVQKDATSNFMIESAFDNNFAAASVVSTHNALGNIQGGVENERYHLSSDQLSLVNSVGADLEFVEYTEKYTNLGALTGAQQISLSNGQMQQITASASTLTITPPAAEAGKSFLLLVNPAIYTVSFSGFYWLNTDGSSIPPVLSPSKKQEISAWSDGINWYSRLVGVQG